MLGILPSTFISGAYTGFKSLHDQSILALLLFCFFSPGGGGGWEGGRSMQSGD